MTKQAAVYESGLYMKHVTYSLQSQTERYPWFIPTSQWPDEQNDAALSVQELLRGFLLTECEYHNVKKLCIESVWFIPIAHVQVPNGKSKSYRKTGIMR